MKIAIAADHGGFSLKADIVELLKQAGHEPIDLGAHDYLAGDDYPDYAQAGRRGGPSRQGRWYCYLWSGVGACIAANKMKGIRAGVPRYLFRASRRGARRYERALLGARIVGVELAREIVLAFARATFNSGERYRRRLNKVLQIEREG
jgi:ribose 5-phosphate isomerase B